MTLAFPKIKTTLKDLKVNQQLSRVKTNMPRVSCLTLGRGQKLLLGPLSDKIMLAEVPPYSNVPGFWSHRPWGTYRRGKSLDSGGNNGIRDWWPKGPFDEG